MGQFDDVINDVIIFLVRSSQHYGLFFSLAQRSHGVEQEHGQDFWCQPLGFFGMVIG